MLLGGHAHDLHDAPIARNAQRHLQRRDSACALEGHVHPAPAGQLHDRRLGVGL